MIQIAVFEELATLIDFSAVELQQHTQVAANWEDRNGNGKRSFVLWLKLKSISKSRRTLGQPIQNAFRHSSGDG